MQTFADRYTAVAVAAVAVWVLLAAAAWQPQPARADGDPASDVLLYQPIDFPYQPAPAAVKRRLTGLVRSANSQGYQVRVAVVQSPRDLGSVPELFGNLPSVYARFPQLGAHERLAQPRPRRDARWIWARPRRGVLREGEGRAADPRDIRPRVPTRRCCGRLPPPSGNSPTALIDAAGRALRALAARHDVSLVAHAPLARAPAAGGGGSHSSEAARGGGRSNVWPTAGLLWFLWRTRPAR